MEALEARRLYTMAQDYVTPDPSGIVYIHTTDNADTFSVQMTQIGVAWYQIIASFSDSSTATVNGGGCQILAYGGGDEITLNNVTASTIYAGFGADRIDMNGCYSNLVYGGPSSNEAANNPGSTDTIDTFNLIASPNNSVLGNEDADHFYTSGNCSGCSLYGNQGADDFHVSGLFSTSRIECGTENDTVYLTGD